MIQGATPGSIVVTNESGWMTADNFVNCLDHFIKHTKSSKENKCILVLEQSREPYFTQALENGSTTIQNITSGLLKSPEEVRPYPKALPRLNKGGRKPGRTRILTDTPEKEAIEAEYNMREEKKRIKKQNSTG
ncbi:unnamed protein product [Acanthoscelides obtectus]|uniref:Uncharacterized protein n=1 Tax=Acanthoscelides obtectus TaxID=200917 RepID=A0A9P0MMR8_ACAOB|nr:unnamed protein product [Acanthoscelides obtectus]CAK1656894.1 hypothetical protein AOBTE_LOCUS20002 [Acanthoscelides obtectus]